MKIISRLDEMDLQTNKTTVALGTFDGIHIGHQKIINQAVKLAKESGGKSIVFTFSNHPLTSIDPRRCPPQIVTQEAKAALIEELGVDILLSIPFTKDFLKITPENFIGMLVEYCNPGHIVVGPNYNYGYKGKGNADTLQQAGLQYGFTVFIHPAVYYHDILVSSTSIRHLILAGKVSQAALLLGRSPRIDGIVISGEQRGRVLGFPTANLAIDNQLVVPGNGIYAVYVYVNGQRHAGVANVGINPTFIGVNRHIEVFIMDFTGNIYGQNIQVDFLEKLRDEKSFDSVDELKGQIARDVEAARNFHK